MDFIKQPRQLFFISCIFLTLFMQIVIGVPVPMHYVFIITSMLLIVTSVGEGMNLNIAVVAFLGAGAISIMGNTIPAFFKPWERFALFVMMMIGCSPLVRGPMVDKVKRQLIMGCIYALLTIAVLSFLGYFLGFGQRLTGIVNSYMGVAGHPNFLGFYTMVSMSFVASMYFRCTIPKERVIFASLWVVCLITLLLSSSRSALALGLLSSLIGMYLRLKQDKARQVRIYFLLAALGIMSLPLLMPYAEAMMKKNMNFDDTDSMVADTRGAIWRMRYLEIEESPVIGVGAYACDVNLPYADVFYVESTGTIELGSSYLGLLSQCGWLGMLTFLWVAIPIIMKTIKYAWTIRTPYAQMCLPIIVCCALNMIFEGYLMTAGAVQCIVVWMILAAADMCDTVADYPVAWEESDPITPEQYEYWRDNIAEDGDKR